MNPTSLTTPATAIADTSLAPLPGLIVRLLRAVLVPLNDASAIVRQDHGAEPARRLDHPTYLRRGLCITGLTEPVARGQ